MISAFIVLIVVVVVLIICLAFYRDSVDALERSLSSFKGDVEYRFIEGKVKEYCQLKGYSNSYYSGGCITFFSTDNGYSESIDVYKLEDKLKELKLVLEKNCPQKCKKVKK